MQFHAFLHARSVATSGRGLEWTTIVSETLAIASQQIPPEAGSYDRKLVMV